MRSTNVLMAWLLLAGCGSSSPSTPDAKVIATADAAPTPDGPSASPADAAVPDAPGGGGIDGGAVADLSCSGAPDPTTAPAMVTLSGTVLQGLLTMGPSEGVLAEILTSD